ncbi:MAG: GxxExxY protein [Terriglobales bacterium]
MSQKSLIMIFQYFRYANDKARIEKILARIASELPTGRVAQRHEGNVAFFLITKDPQIFEAIERTVDNRPGSQGTTTNRAVDLKHRELTDKIIGVFYDVYNELGHGFLESVYQGAMEIALKDAGLRVDREVAIPVWFRKRDVGNFKADLLVEGCVLLELKAAQAIDRAHEAQIMNYLRATEIEVGLLLNFGPKPQFKRFVFEKERKIRVHPRESAVGKP